ncbi:HEAT repeat domain-containing protein [Tundrisphaera lichenicola]|uniref:HEAT repeat domain-containing protein n=1 Tax=Tundrisphaera lichenicola TaxID=2029860 RepID=UPI003EBF32AB
MSQRAGHAPTNFLISILAVALLSPVGSAQGPLKPESDPAVAIELWSHGDHPARIRALRKLCRSADVDASVVPLLIPGLSDPDPRIRAGTADVLRRIGQPARQAAPALLNALDDPDRDVRDSVALALAATDPDPKRLIPSFVSHLKARTDRYAASAMKALEEIGEPVIPAIIEILNGENPASRRHACEALVRIGPSARLAIPALIEALKRPDDWTRDAAIGTLGQIGPDAVGPLTRALEDRDPKVRGGAARALEHLGPQAANAAPALIRSLLAPGPIDEPAPARESDNEGWRRDGEPRPAGSYAVLRAIGEPAVPVLLGQLDRPEIEARIVALRAIGFLGGDAKGTVPRLTTLLSDPKLRAEAASALGGIGPSARPAIPVLITALKDPIPAFRSRVAETLGRIGWCGRMRPYVYETAAQSAIDPLISALQDPDPSVRAAVARALEDIGDEASAALPRLLVLLGDPSADVRLACLRALPRLGVVQCPEVGTFLGLLKDSDPRVRLASAKLFGNIDLGSDPVISGLLDALDDPNADVRAEVALKLSSANDRESRLEDVERQREASRLTLARSPNAGDTLRKALADSDPRVRAQVVATLSLFPKEAVDSVPLITARLKDMDVRVRLAAAVALGQFSADASSAEADLSSVLSDFEGLNVNDFDVSSKAAQALRAIGPEAEARMIDRLFVLLASPEEKVRRHVADTLQHLGEKISARLYQAMVDPKSPRLVKAEVLHILAERHGVGIMNEGDSLGDFPGLMPNIPEALLTLHELIHDADFEVRVDARSLLATLQRGGEEAARTLLDAARAEDSLRYWDVESLAEALSPSTMNLMVEALKDSDERVRDAASMTLAALAEKLPRPDEDSDDEPLEPAEAEARSRGLRLRVDAADALVPLLKDSDLQVRWNATWALYVLGASEKAVGGLVEMAGEGTTRMPPGTQVRLASLLGSGNSNYCEYPSDGEFLRLGAIQALGGFGDLAAPAVPMLIEALRDQDLKIRSYAAGVLAEIGPKADAAIPELIPLLLSKDRGERVPGTLNTIAVIFRPDRLAVAAAKALGRIGRDSREAIDALAKALDDTDQPMRSVVAQALGDIGPKAAPAIPALIEALGDQDLSVAEQAVWALERIGAASVPALIEAILRPELDLRRRAIETLGEIGPDAVAARPGLIRARMDPDPEIRSAATQALDLINEPAPPD